MSGFALEGEVPSGQSGQCWRAGASRAANSGFAASKEVLCSAARHAMCVWLLGGRALVNSGGKSPDAVARLASSQRARRAATPTSELRMALAAGRGLLQLQLQADAWQVGRGGGGGGGLDYLSLEQERRATSRLKGQQPVWAVWGTRPRGVKRGFEDKRRVHAPVRPVRPACPSVSKCVFGCAAAKALPKPTRRTS